LVFTAALTDIFYHLKISNGPKCTAGTARMDLEMISGLTEVQLREAWPWLKLTTSSTAAQILISDFCFILQINYTNGNPAITQICENNEWKQSRAPFGVITVLT